MTAGWLAKRRWISRISPLRQGIVPWANVFACLRKIGFDGWVSFHSEYQGWHSWRELNVEELLAQTKDDLDYVRHTIRTVDDHGVEPLVQPGQGRAKK